MLLLIANYTKNNRKSFFHSVYLDKNFDETFDEILNIIMDKNKKRNCQISQLNLFRKTKISEQIKVNSCAQYTVFVYFKFSRRKIGQMGRLFFDYV